jgi:hypothetical protein
MHLQPGRRAARANHKHVDVASPAECGDGGQCSGLSTRRTQKQQAPVTVWHTYAAPVLVRCIRAVLEGPGSLSRPSCARLLAAVVAMI